MRVPRVGSPPLEVPVTTLSSGELIVTSQNVTYTHDPEKWKRYQGLRDLSFSVPIRGLEVALVQFDLAAIRQFNLPYICFHHLENTDVGGPLLVSASGLGPFTFLIRRRTKRLFDEIVRAGAVALPSNFTAGPLRS